MKKQYIENGTTNIPKTIAMLPSYEEVLDKLRDACKENPSKLESERYAKNVADTMKHFFESKDTKDPSDPSDEAIRDSILDAIKRFSPTKLLIYAFKAAAMDYPQLFTFALSSIIREEYMDNGLYSGKITKAKLMEKYLKASLYVYNKLDEYISKELLYIASEDPKEQCRDIENISHKFICDEILKGIEGSLMNVFKAAVDQMFGEFRECTDEVRGLIDSFYDHDNFYIGPVETIATEL